MERRQGKDGGSARMETGCIAMATKNKMTENRQGATKEHAGSEQTRESSCRSEGTRRIRGEHSGRVSGL